MGMGVLSRARPYSDVYSKRIRRNGCELWEGKFSWDKGRKFFTERLYDGAKSQRSCGVPPLANIWNSTVQGHEQPDNYKSSPEVTSNLTESVILKKGTI